MNTEFSCFIGSRSDNTAALRASADTDWFTNERGVFYAFNRNKKTIEVNVGNIFLARLHESILMTKGRKDSLQQNRFFRLDKVSGVQFVNIDSAR